MRTAAAQLLNVKKRAEAGLCPASAQRGDKPTPLSFRTSDRCHWCGNPSLPKGGADCRVASLLAMTARRCRADGTSGRRPLRVVQRTCPVGRDPCVPPFCSCHSEFVGADDSARPHALAWESAFPKRRTDCRVAALLAMTARRCRADGTSGRRPLRAVQRTCPVGRDPCVPSFCSCHSEFVGADDSVRPHALAWESAFPKRRTDCHASLYPKGTCFAARTGLQ